MSYWGDAQDHPPYSLTKRHAGASSEAPEWKRIRLVPALMRMITRVNLPVFVGDELGKSIAHNDDDSRANLMIKAARQKSWITS